MVTIFCDRCGRGFGSARSVLEEGLELCVSCALSPRSVYLKMVHAQADALNAATDLEWTHEETGGGHDALMAHFDHPADYGKEYPRLAYVMLTCDASVVYVGRDRSACLAFYPDSDPWTDSDLEVNIGGDHGILLTLQHLEDFVGEFLRNLGVI